MVLFRKKKESGDISRIIQLTIIEGNNDTGDPPGKVFNLQSGNNFIGRDPLCEIVLNSGTVSRRHANLKVSYDKQKFLMIDLGSFNGVIIMPSTVIKKGKKSINSGDEVQIGEILLKLLALDQDEQLQTMGVDVQDILKQTKEKAPGSK
ncbi:MAG: FHA domain-containing protein [Candidatus Aminicenantes bacterium]|nr:FHA domain-containing protein [Candidatus Aminicenantes bacterium]